MIVVPYLRTSGVTDADDDSASLPAQLVAIVESLPADTVILAPHADNGLSGALSLDQRPALAEAVASIPEDATVLAVHRLDRLARDLLIQEAVLAEIWRQGGEVWVAELGELVRKDDPDDPTRKFIRIILGGVAELERGLVVARLQRGRRRAQAAGKMAYGFAVPGTLEPDPGRPGYARVREDGVRAVLRARELREEGCSWTQVARGLNDEGFTAPRGGEFYASTARRTAALPIPDLPPTAEEDGAGGEDALRSEQEGGHPDGD